MPNKYKKIYNSRKNLNENINPSEELDKFFFENFYINTWYNVPFYGRVDVRGIPVILREERIKLASFGNDITQTQAVDFTADLFKDLKKEYESCYASGLLNKNSKFFKSKITAIKGFSTSRPNYLEKLKNIYSSFLTYIIDGNISNKINDYPTFLETLKTYIYQKDLYLTRAGFNESKDISILNTGLALDVYDGNPDDFAVVEKYYKDINYNAFLEICLRNGFIINKEIPWRIICDIRQKKVEDKIIQLNKNYNISFEKEDFLKNLQKIFDIYYEPVLPINELSFIYFKEFISVVEGFYRSYIFQFPRDKFLILDSCQNAKIENVLKKQISKFNNTDDMYRFYLKLFFDFRKIEIRDNIEDTNFNNISFIAIAKFDQFIKSDFRKAIYEAVDFFSRNTSTVTFRERSIIQGGPIKGPA